MRTSRVWLLLAAALVIGWSIGARGEQESSEQTPVKDANSPAADAVRFSVTASGEHAILLDSTSGQTWLLTASIDENEPPVWRPLQRFQTAEEFLMWEEKNKREEKNKLENALKQFSADHPQIQELQDSIERLEQLHSELGNRKPARSDSEIASQILPLILELEELRLHRGENHPEVIALKQRIELTRGYLQKSSISR